jgi:hypothetical protein
MLLDCQTPQRRATSSARAGNLGWHATCRSGAGRTCGVRGAQQPTLGSHCVRCVDEGGQDAVAGIGLGAVALMVTFVVARGEARGHAFGHLVIGAALLGLFAATGSAWHPRAGSSLSNCRAPFLIVLWIASVATFLESIGAAGHDKFNAGHRLEWADRAPWNCDAHRRFRNPVASAVCRGAGGRACWAAGDSPARGIELPTLDADQFLEDPCDAS